MDTWFGATSDYRFALFSFDHLLMLSIAFLGLLFLVLARGWLSAHAQLFHSLRWPLFGILLLSEISYQYWAISHDVWKFNEQMPLHLCGIASLVAMTSLLTLRPFWIRIAFFIGIVPVALALVTPELPYDYHHYRFWKFSVHHIAVFWTSILLAMIYPTVITLRSVFTVYALLLGYASVIGFVVNPLMDANFLYLAGTPSTASPLDFFGDGIWYYVNLCVAALVLFLSQYALFRGLVKRKKAERS